MRIKMLLIESAVGMVGARRLAPRRLKFASRHVGSEPQLIYNPTVHGEQRLRRGRLGSVSLK